ncbi:MAG: Holliday junction branch migration DNA helicase RuvB [Candidatus Ancaeobacter aquaticus]|nr:Holliday junction branch migration DNA helicase RuvB [Candidatus Ancaeobacter aquaticus]
MTNEMVHDQHPISSLAERDLQYEVPLRPDLLDDFIGQEKIKERLTISIEAAAQRNEALEHTLFSGPPGLGKTTLANIVAKKVGANIKTTSGPAIEKAGDLAGLLTGLENGDVLFIDEIHRLNHVVEEYLYPAMEDFVLDIMIDKGPAARSVRLNLPRFTLIGATTRSGLLTSPLRSRFGIVNRLDYYNEKAINEIVKRSAKILNVEVDAEGSLEIAKRSRGTPRIANCLLRRVRDYAQIKADNWINKDVADQALNMFDIDEFGLDEMDKKILTTIIEKFSGGPVGVSTIATAVGEETGTIEEVYEPYLIQQGYIKRTPSGRVITPRAQKYFGKGKKIQAQDELF